MARCLFCQQRDAKISVEHVLSKPITDCIPGDGPYEVILWGREANGPPEVRATFGVPRPTLTRKIYCEPCNNNWMQEMDVAITPIVCPLIRGEQHVLSHEDRVSLAAWIAKVALVNESLSGAAKVVPDSEYHRFFHERRPMEAQPIHLANYTGNTFVQTSSSRGLAIVNGQDGSKAQATLITFVIGSLVARTCIPPIAFGFDRIYTPTDACISIWPVLGAYATWPPPMDLGDAELREFTTEAADDAAGVAPHWIPPEGI